ncbi:MAG: GNAT family N-acetyltransferase [Candidatus Hodarchaeota archaeon]
MVLKDRGFFRIDIEIAKSKDAFGVYNALKENLIEINDFDKISKEQRKYLENRGFLRKEVDIKYYEELIEDSKCDIYIAKNMDGDIIGFASIHKNKYNIADFRTTLDNLYTDHKEIEELLTSKEKEFAYLDQISIVPDYQRKGVGTAILNQILTNTVVPIVAFIVEVPLANKASARWHEYNGFERAAKCDGIYKEKKFQWWIYIHWNYKY